MPSRQQLAEFDYVLLGAVWRGYTTGYAIRNLILRTKGSRWSGSTGAVYPALRRLTAQGYLHVATKAEGPRSRTSYQVSEKGEKALRDWLKNPVQEEDLGLLSDPLRSRCVNLRMLKPSERMQVVAQWIVQNDQYIEYLQERLRQENMDHFVRLGFLNLTQLLEGRRRWLFTLAEEVGLKRKEKSD